ncbi:MAG TPA: trigger factor [Verrucomicrobiae bacterium]|nr:trigger factor [Verrucomicrobiae bacterium]
MNVTVENLAPCKRLVRVELEAQAVDAAFDRLTADFQKQARLPGFRPGKAPKHLVLKAYTREIEEEAKRKLISDSYRKALDEQKLRVVGYPDIEEIQFGRGQALQFAATIEIAPDFELPDYKGIPVKREIAAVTDADVDRAINTLRDQRASYNDVDRAVEAGDFVVVNYKGTSEGKPLTDFAPAARGLTEKSGFWLHIEENSFIPGFTTQLIGAKAGEKRAVNVKFPDDFVAPQLAGKEGNYEVEITQVKVKVLPELNDEFAKSFGANDLDHLRTGVRSDLENELGFKQKRAVRDQLVKSLLERVTCELPESVVMNETRSVVYDIVRENQQRGVPKEMLDEQKDQIFSFANNSAKDRVKAAFIISRVADKENIRVDDREVTQRVLFLAERNQIKPEKFVKQLQERNGIAQIRDELLNAKVLDFLELNAKVEDALPNPTPA